MPKQKTENHTKARQFRLPEPTLAALDRIASRYQVDRTTAIKLAIGFFDRQDSKKNPKNSETTA